MRAPSYVLLGLVAALPLARALDMATVERVLKEFGDNPCRLELLALGMSFVSAHGCVTALDSLASADRCNDKVFDFLDTFGQVLKKEKCADPLAQIINAKVVNVDLKPIFKILTDLYDCSKTSDDTSVCKNDAVPALLRIGSQFANELFDGFSPEFEKLAVNAMESEVTLGECIGHSPTLKDTLSVGDYTLVQAKAQPLVDTINEFGRAPLKSVLDDKQQWAVDRLMEILNEQSPLSVHGQGLQVGDLKDWRKCASAWTTYSTYMGQLLKSDELRQARMRLFDRLPLINALRPWYQAFFDNVDAFVSDVLPKGQCFFEWEGASGLEQCMEDAGSSLALFTKKVQSSEAVESKQDKQEGWTEDHAFLSERVFPSPSATPSSTVSVAATPTAPVTLRPISMPPLSHPDARNGGGWAGTFGHLVLGLVVAALVAASAVYARGAHPLQRLRGFRPLAQREGDALDVEAQGLLNEFSDSEDSDDDMIDL